MFGKNKKFFFFVLLSSAFMIASCSSPAGSASSHIIRFDSNGGTEIAGEVIFPGHTVFQPGDPVMGGARFLGWFTDNDSFARPYNFYSQVKHDFTLYARWESPGKGGGGSGGGGASGANSGSSGSSGSSSGTSGNSGSGGSTGSGGSGSGDSSGSSGDSGGSEGSDVTGNDNADDPSDPDNSGNTDSDGNSPEGSNTGENPETNGSAVESDVAVVSFESNGGNPVASRTVHVGDALNMSEIPVRRGYNFDGWYTDNKSFRLKYNFLTPVMNNITLYAKWVARESGNNQGGKNQDEDDQGKNNNKQRIFN